MNCKRKRDESEEEEFLRQKKVFVNERIVENNNVEKLSKIYEKTHKILFAGANQRCNQKDTGEKSTLCYQSVLLCGNGEVRDATTNNVNNLPDSLVKSCSGCLKFSTKFHGICINCNLELCEFCGYSCSNCQKEICEPCIKMYNCGSFENPICGNCRIYQ
ncbi:hypothetical protein DMENIID0001_111290 [Sergentomyia squamirostris]